jgi:hypothetical protein
MSKYDVLFRQMKTGCLAQIFFGKRLSCAVKPAVFSEEAKP